MSFISRHKLIVTIGTIVVLAGAWYTLSGSSAPAPTLTTSTSAPAGVAPADQNLVTTLLALRAVTLDGTIFTDPAFESLQDFSTPIVPEPVGRTDPFAPLSPEASASASTTQSAQIFAPHH